VSGPRNEWALTQEAFDRLLGWLDPDAAAAARKYEQTRRSLLKFFEVRRCVSAEEQVDRVIDRVARRVSEGVEVYAANPFLYFHGVALNVFQEYLRKQIAPMDVPVPHPEDSARMQQRLECMEACLDGLPPETRRMMVDYCTVDKASKKRTREVLAERLGMSVNSLRIRVHRVREQLERCVTICLSPPVETKP
jgi:DNA-directed RNA polymerase specialized sigma24 family protein